MQVLQLLKDIISEERLYDDRNASIVLADQDLEIALDVRALHLTEIRLERERRTHLKLTEKVLEEKATLKTCLFVVDKLRQFEEEPLFYLRP